MSLRSPARTVQPSEGLQRRRELRRRKRRYLAAQLWSLLVLVAASTGLGWLLVRHAWLLSSPTQLELQATAPFSREQVISAAGLRFPTPMLGLDGTKLKRRLEGNLPVEQVSLQRQLWPPQLRINMRLRRAVARAQRQTTQGREYGYVDRTGSWISRAQQEAAQGQPVPPLTVVGWQPQHAGTVERLLKDLPTSAGVKQLEFRGNGELWLQSSRLGPVRLGNVDQQLQRRLQVLDHLAGQPPQPQERTQALDLSDPEHPELVLPASKSSEN